MPQHSLSKVCKSLGHCVQFKAWDLSHRLGSARRCGSWIHLFHSGDFKGCSLRSWPPSLKPSEEATPDSACVIAVMFFGKPFQVWYHRWMSTQSFLTAARGRTCPAQPCCPRKLGFPTETVPALLGDITQPCTGPTDKPAPKPHSSFHFSLLLFLFLTFLLFSSYKSNTSSLQHIIQ